MYPNRDGRREPDTQLWSHALTPLVAVSKMEESMGEPAFPRWARLHLEQKDRSYEETADRRADSGVWVGDQRGADHRSGSRPEQRLAERDGERRGEEAIY